MRDVNRSAAFSSELGFAEVVRTPSDPSEGLLIHVDVELDGYRLGLACLTSTHEDHGLTPGDVTETGPTAAVVLCTGDVPHAYRRLLEAGARGIREPYPWLGQLLVAWVVVQRVSTVGVDVGVGGPE